MGQVWSKADFDGINEFGNHGGRGSVLAVTAQNPGPDGEWGTNDDLLTPMNHDPADVSIDWTPNNTENDDFDRVRGFYSFHSGGAIFGLGDASTRFVSETIDLDLYRHLSTSRGREVLTEF